MGTALLRGMLVGTIAVSLGVGCGYEATPTSIELRATPADGGPSLPFSLGGTSDPEASAFATGIMLWTRWATNRDGVRTVELFIDLNRDHLPAGVDADAPPETLRGDDQVVATLRGRDSQGKVIVEQRATSTQIEVDRLADSGARQLHQGNFALVWPAGGPYVDIVGSWETLPRPSSPATVGGDFAPTPGDVSSPGDTAFPRGDDDVITFDSAGCACVGEVDEDIPEEPTEPDTVPEDTAPDSGGCDCQGDAVDEEPTEPPPEPDPSTDEGSDGCDCKGDPPPDEPTASRSSSAVRIAQVKRHCRRGPVRMGMELSPLLFVWGLSVYRRRRR